MKKSTVVVTLSMLVLMLSASIAQSACPSINEFHAKNNDFQRRAMTTTSQGGITQLLSEQEAYYDSIVPGCIQYFKTTASPVCDKLSVLATGYMILDDSKKPAAKAQIDALKKSLNGKCQMQVQALDYMVK